MIPRTRPRSPLIAKLLLLAGCGALVFVVSAMIRETQRRNAVASEIHAMESEIAKLEQQRARVSDLLKQAETPDFLEREARLRLGLQKPGETVLIVPESAGRATVAGEAQGAPAAPPSNAAKWWQRMFR